MKVKPAVSVLVPVYNVERYLGECLDGILAQTLKDIEVICVDDGSTDGSAAILERYAAADGRVVVIRKSNGGLPSARNAGLDAATGEYVGFVDADDRVDAGMFERLYRAARANRADVAVCGGRVFPGEDEAPAWLKEALSPRDIVYRTDCLAALYEERGARPFLWRDLVRRELIQKNGLRLDESIVVGEDQAFQFKIFAAARRAVFISDKLYNYRYSRSGSIMNEAQYRDYGARVSKHVKMTGSIMRDGGGTLLSERNAARFFDWAVDFVYWDLIRVNACERAAIAEDFCGMLIGGGYFLHCAKCAAETRARFEYMYGLAGGRFAPPDISVVVAFGGDGRYLGDCLDSLLAQSARNIEILLYENDASPAVRDIAFRYARADARICLRLGERRPLSEKYNDALVTAKGRYIAFMNNYDYIRDRDWLKNSAAALDGDGEVALVGYREGCLGKADIKKCQNADYRQFLYRMRNIREAGIAFEDYALLTGRVFFTGYCLAGRYARFIPRFMLRSRSFKRVSICRKEAELTLEAAAVLLREAREHDLPELSFAVAQSLNSENNVRLITDCTYGFDRADPAAGAEDEESNARILALLLKLNALVEPSGGDRALLRMLSSFISLRHRFLEDI